MDKYSIIILKKSLLSDGRKLIHIPEEDVLIMDYCALIRQLFFLSFQYLRRYFRHLCRWLTISPFLPYDILQNAAAMCGVNIPVGDISMNIPTSLPLSVPVNPIGMEIRKIPNSKSLNSKEKKNDHGTDILSTRLQDVSPSSCDLVLFLSLWFADILLLA